MSDTTKAAQRAFSDRLRAKMMALGFTSRGNPTGVDITALAKASDTTYEMARRYAAGEALPRPGKISAIARWLGVQPSELVFGTSPQPGIDEQLLRQCIQTVQAAQARTQAQLPPEKTAHLVAVLYQEAITGTMPSPQSVDLMSKAAAT